MSIANLSSQGEKQWNNIDCNVIECNQINTDIMSISDSLTVTDLNVLGNTTGIALNDLDDVSYPAPPNNNDVLTWDNLFQEWQPKPAGGGGENNTASNVGAGDGVFKQKVGVDLEFKSVIGNKINVTNNVDDLTLEASLDMNDLNDVNIPAPIKGDLIAHNGVNYSAIPVGAVGTFLTPSPLFPNGFGWVDINSFRAIAQMHYLTNFGAPIIVNIVGANNWTVVTGLSVGELLNVGFAGSILTPGLAGAYQVTGGVSARVQGGNTDLLEWGIGINGANPIAQNSLAGEEVANLWISQPFTTIVRVNALDTVQIYVRNLTANRDVQIGSLQFCLVKIAN